MTVENHLGTNYHYNSNRICVIVFEEAEAAYMTHHVPIPFIVLKRLEVLVSGQYQALTISI